MKHLNNKTNRYLSTEEQQALLVCEEALTKAFKKRVFAITVNPLSNNPDDVFGVSIAFDEFSEGYR